MYLNQYTYEGLQPSFIQCSCFGTMCLFRYSLLTLVPNLQTLSVADVAKTEKLDINILNKQINNENDEH